MIEFIVFGIIDNLVMIIGAITGCEVEKYLPARFQKGLGAVVGAGIGNATSDWLGGVGAGNFLMANGTFLSDRLQQVRTSNLQNRLPLEGSQPQ